MPQTVTFIGHPGARFQLVTGDEGEEFNFPSGRPVGIDLVPKSVLKRIEDKDDLPGAEFVIGDERKTETAVEAQAQAIESTSPDEKKKGA